MTDREADTDDCPFLGGKLLLRQMRSGHRAGTDACLLAAALDLADCECIADVGAGVGAAGLAALVRAPGSRAVLIERLPEACALARHNATVNGAAERVRVVEADVFDRSALAGAGLVGCADVVISNPPFYESHAVRPSPDAMRAAAHVLDGETRGAWLRALVRMARSGGRLAMIHVPEALPALLQAWPPGWGEITLRWIHPFEDRVASRVILSARGSSRAPLMVLPPLVLHDRTGAFTPEAESIHRGVAQALMKRPA